MLSPSIVASASSSSTSSTRAPASRGSIASSCSIASGLASTARTAPSVCASRSSGSGEHAVEAAAARERERLLAAVGERHLAALVLEDLPDVLGERVVVIDDEHARPHATTSAGATSSAGSAPA